jgi:predicted dinucleotide-binding enzyme
MRVGILGSGHVGRTLGPAFAKHGHDVAMATREPEGEGARVFLDAVGEAGWVDTYAEVSKWCELAVFASRWIGAAAILEACGPDNLAGKVVIDVSNPLSGKGLDLVVGGTDSAGEIVQRAWPKARVVKAFNIVGYNLMVSPKLPGGPPTMLIAGNDENAKEIVAGILDDFGWETSDLGDITASRAIEGVGLAWMLYGRHAGRDHAFKMLRG